MLSFSPDEKRQNILSAWNNVDGLLFATVLDSLQADINPDGDFTLLNLYVDGTYEIERLSFQEFCNGGMLYSGGLSIVLNNYCDRSQQDAMDAIETHIIKEVKVRRF
jgi:hypothetical protein